VEQLPQAAATEAGGFTAATLVVRDALSSEDLDVALEPWRSLQRLPVSWFGPNTDAIEAMLDEIPTLSNADLRRILEAWRQRPANDIVYLSWRVVGEGLAGTRSDCWSRLVGVVPGPVAAGRRVEAAMFKASLRSPGPAEWETADRRDLHNALSAGAAAIVLADLVPAAVSDDLLEGWRARR